MRRPDLQAIREGVVEITDETLESYRAECDRLNAERAGLRAAISRVEAVIDGAERKFRATGLNGPEFALLSAVRAALAGSVAPEDEGAPNCICDGGAYIEHMKPDWRPFVVSPQCVIHGIGATPTEPATLHDDPAESALESSMEAPEWFEQAGADDE